MKSTSVAKMIFGTMGFTSAVAFAQPVLPNCLVTSPAQVQPNYCEVTNPSDPCCGYVALPAQNWIRKFVDMPVPGSPSAVCDMSGAPAGADERNSRTCVSSVLIPSNAPSPSLSNPNLIHMTWTDNGSPASADLQKIQFGTTDIINAAGVESSAAARGLATNPVDPNVLTLRTIAGRQFLAQNSIAGYTFSLALFKDQQLNDGISHLQGNTYFIALDASINFQMMDGSSASSVSTIMNYPRQILATDLNALGSDYNCPNPSGGAAIHFQSSHNISVDKIWFGGAQNTWHVIAPADWSIPKSLFGANSIGGTKRDQYIRVVSPAPFACPSSGAGGPATDKVFYELKSFQVPN